MGTRWQAKRETKHDIHGVGRHGTNIAITDTKFSTIHDWITDR